MFNTLSTDISRMKESQIIPFKLANTNTILGNHPSPPDLNTQEMTGIWVGESLLVVENECVHIAEHHWFPQNNHVCL